jgi:hypothetical protein
MSSIKNCFKIFKNLDYFGVQLNFQYDNKQKFRSVFGGVTFFCFFVFAMTFTFLNFKNFSNRTMMNLVFNENYSEKAPEIRPLDYSMQYAVGLEVGNPSKLPLLYQYIDIHFISVTLQKINGTVIKSKKLLNMTKCTKELFFNINEAGFNSLGLQNYFCPDLTNFSIQGIWTEEIFKYFEFVTFLKPEIYTNNNLTLLNEARKLFIDYEIKSSLYYIDTSITVSDYSNPINKFFNSIFIVCDWRFFKKMNLDYMYLKFISDSDMLFRDEVTFNKDFVVLDSLMEYFGDINEDRFTKSTNPRPRDFDTFSKLYIRSSPKSRLTKRVYMKLTEYLANMSSILSSLLLILFLIVARLNLFKAQQSIMQKVLRFKENLEVDSKDSIKYMRHKFKSLNQQGVVKDLEDIKDLKILDNTNNLNEKNKISTDAENFNLKSEDKFITSTENQLKYMSAQHTTKFKDSSVPINDNYMKSGKLADAQETNSKNSNNINPLIFKKNYLNEDKENKLEPIESVDNDNESKFNTEKNLINYKDQDMEMSYINRLNKNKNEKLVPFSIPSPVPSSVPSPIVLPNNNFLTSNSQEFEKSLNIQKINSITSNQFENIEENQINKKDNYENNNPTPTPHPYLKYNPYAKKLQKRFTPYPKNIKNSTKSAPNDKILIKLPSNKLHGLSSFKLQPKNLFKHTLFRENLKMHYNECEILAKSICCCFLSQRQKLKKELYEFGYAQYSHHMSILSYLRKMHEIDILKYILLDEKQTTLFNFVSKPSLSLLNNNDFVDKLKMKFDSDFNKEEIDNVYKSFLEIANFPQSKKDCKDINIKLLNYVASEIDHLTVEL